jgi:hypothetical protein
MVDQNTLIPVVIPWADAVAVRARSMLRAISLRGIEKRTSLNIRMGYVLMFFRNLP